MFPCIYWERPSFIFCPMKKDHVFGEKNTIFPDNTRKIMCRRDPSWKEHLFRTFEENIIFPCIFWERSSFIFRLRCKIIFSGKGNIIFPDNTKKIMFQRNSFGKTIFSGRPEKKDGFPCSDYIRIISKLCLQTLIRLLCFIFNFFYWIFDFAIINTNIEIDSETFFSIKYCKI